jgi:hypothetical protein
MQFREALAKFKKVCRRNNKNLVNDFEIIIGFTNQNEECEDKHNLVIKPQYDWLLVW